MPAEGSKHSIMNTHESISHEIEEAPTSEVFLLHSLARPYEYIVNLFSLSYHTLFKMGYRMGGNRLPSFTLSPNRKPYATLGISRVTAGYRDLSKKKKTTPKFFRLIPSTFEPRLYTTQDDVRHVVTASPRLGRLVTVN